MDQKAETQRIEAADDGMRRGLRPGARRLFVLSGGGLPGLDIHAGLWAALEHHRIFPNERDLIRGTSAGAIVGALMATPYWNAQRGISLLRSLRDDDVLERRWFRKFLAFHRGHFIENRRIRRLLEAQLDTRWSDLRCGFEAFATDEETGDPVVLDGTRPLGNYIPLAKAVLASMSICGIFPAVETGLPTMPLLSDGGTATNVPLGDDWMEYDEVFVLCASRSLAFKHRRSSAVHRLMWNIDLLMEDQVGDARREVEPHVVDPIEGPVDPRGPRVFWLRPPVSSPEGSLSFNHQLIETVKDWAVRELQFSLAE